MIVEIVFAAGCFWGVEKHFESLDGVVNVVSGYSGGNYENPTYKDVLKYRSTDKNSKVINHTEAVKVSFDNTKIDAKTLIKSFWEIHDPTQVNRQGNDIGNNYRSAIYWTNENQNEVAQNTKNEFQTLLSNKGFGKIATEIKPLEAFWSAEAYHQDYLKRNIFGYCPNHSTGIKFSKDDKKVDLLTPVNGKEIIVVESKLYCPYCEKFKKEVSSSYKGTVPMRSAYAEQLTKYKIDSQLFATPTILFVENGSEIVGHKGFMDKETFYETLEDFKSDKK